MSQIPHLLDHLLAVASEGENEAVKANFALFVEKAKTVLAKDPPVTMTYSSGGLAVITASQRQLQLHVQSGEALPESISVPISGNVNRPWAPEDRSLRDNSVPITGRPPR